MRAGIRIRKTRTEMNEERALTRETAVEGALNSADRHRIHSHLSRGQVDGKHQEWEHESAIKGQFRTCQAPKGFVWKWTLFLIDRRIHKLLAYISI